MTVVLSFCVARLRRTELAVQVPRACHLIHFFDDMRIWESVFFLSCSLGRWFLFSSSGTLQ